MKLREGNVFDVSQACVIPSVHSGGGGLPACNEQEGVTGECDWGVLPEGCNQRGVTSEGVTGGWCVAGGGVHLPSPQSTSWWYATCWNALVVYLCQFLEGNSETIGGPLGVVSKIDTGLNYGPLLQAVV